MNAHMSETTHTHKTEKWVRIPATKHNKNDFEKEKRTQMERWS